MKRVNTVISLVSGGLVLFLAGSAFLLSFDALQSLAVAAGISESRAWLYPAIIDGSIIIFSLSVLRANLNREAVLYPWTLVSIFTLLSIILNITHAQSGSNEAGKRCHFAGKWGIGAVSGRKGSISVLGQVLWA